MAQDDEPTLMLAVATAHEQQSSIPSYSPSPTSPHISVPPQPAPSAPSLAQQPPPAAPVQPPQAPPAPCRDGAVLHLVEKKVFAVLDSKEDLDPQRWILDTGASIHMSGSRAAFANLDSGITGSVPFGDGSVTQIEGTGTVLFSCKNGEHQSLPNVYYLPRLTANIISVGQLDEGGYQVLVEDGVMRIRDEERRLLAKIPRSPGRLYVLDVTIACPVCLAARTDDDAWTWHSRFSHIHFAALRKMAREELVLACPCSIRWSRFARPASPASNVECLSRRRRSGVQQRCSDSSTVTLVVPSRRRHPAATGTFFCLLMITPDICGSPCCHPRMLLRRPSSTFRPRQNARQGRRSRLSAPIAEESLPQWTSPQTAPSSACDTSSRRHTRPNRTAWWSARTKLSWAQHAVC